MIMMCVAGYTSMYVGFLEDSISGLSIMREAPGWVGYDILRHTAQPASVQKI